MNIKYITRRKEMTISGKEVTIYRSTERNSPLVVLSTYGDEGAAVFSDLKKLTSADITLAAVGITDWNGELSPWEIPPVYKNDEPFTGGADAYLATLTGDIIPAVISEAGIDPEYTALAGYSLAGLFALYSMYKTDVFSRIASVSGSVWFPGFTGYAKSNKPMRAPDRLYLSLGDKESHTRNSIMSQVEKNTRELYDHFGSLGIRTEFEMNPGNHFRDTALRMAKGIAWIIES